jgi:hypothetical protein
MQPPLAEIAGVNLVMPCSSRPDAAIAELLHEFDTPAAKSRGVTIVAASDGYLAVWIMPNSMTGPGSIDASNPYHTEPLQLLVLCQLTRRWPPLPNEEVPDAPSEFLNRFSHFTFRASWSFKTSETTESSS